MAAPRPAKAANTPAEWAMAIGGGLLLALALVWVLRGGGDAPARNDATAPAVQSSAVPGGISPPAAPTFVPPLPQPAAGGAGNGPAAPAAPATGAQGLKLRGIIARSAGTAGAAILESADGKQRLVRIGQQAAPGVRVIAVTAGSVTLAAAGQEFQLDLGDARPAARPAPALANALARRITGWKLALEPRRQQGRINGFTVLPGPLPPVLERAGLRPGDVLLSVNKGQLSSTERVGDLEEDVGSSYVAEFEFERVGKRQIKTLEIQPKS
jgi:hypothetical protein